MCSGVVLAEKQIENKRPLKCEVGPVNKQFGGVQWLVYACDDNKSIVVVSAPGNPAMPFYFSIYLDGEQYRVSGEGAGDAAASSAARKDIEAFTREKIETLIVEANDV